MKKRKSMKMKTGIYNCIICTEDLIPDEDAINLKDDASF